MEAYCRSGLKVRNNAKWTWNLPLTINTILYNNNYWKIFYWLRILLLQYFECCTDFSRFEQILIVCFGFRARQHLRSLAPVMNDNGWQWWPNDIQGPWSLKLPDICLTGEEKPRKNLIQETCPDRESNPGPLRDNKILIHSFITVV